VKIKRVMKMQYIGNVVKSKIAGWFLVSEDQGLQEAYWLNTHGDSEGNLYLGINGKEEMVTIKQAWEIASGTLKRAGYKIDNLVLTVCYPDKVKSKNVHPNVKICGNGNEKYSNLSGYIDNNIGISISVPKKKIVYYVNEIGRIFTNGFVPVEQEYNL
jgi:hypothetical protein